jgi:MFS family permease
MVQLAILPAMTAMAAHFTDAGYDGAFIAQNVMTVAAPTMAVGAPLIGWLAERVGKRRTLLGSALVYTLAGIAGAFAPDIWTMLASRLILGLAAAGIATTTIAFLGDYYDRGRRDRLIGWYGVVGGGGSLVTLFVAGKAAELGGWHAVFALYLIGLVVLAGVLLTVSDIREETSAMAAAEDSSIWGAWWIYLLIVAISIVMYSVTIQGSFLLADRGITSPSVQSNIINMTTIGSMAGAYLCGRIRPALGFLVVLALTWGLMGAGNLGFGLFANPWALAVFGMMTGLASGLMQPLTQNAILNRVPPGASAKAVGLAIGCIFLGQFLHPFILRPMRESLGIEGAFVWLGAASLAAMAIALIRRLRGDIVAARTV